MIATTMLKPCPFCGGEATFGGNRRTGKRDIYVYCMKCNARIKKFEKQKDAVEFWNTRRLEDESVRCRKQTKI